MNLYEIDNAILSCVDPETGEIFDLEWLDKLQMERERKIENVLCWVKNLESDAEQIKAEEKALADRRKSAEAKADRLRSYIGGILNGEKFQTPKVSVSWRKSDGVVIDNLNELMKEDDYLTYKEPEPNKSKIKAAIKAGVVVPGAHLEERHNMSIK